MKDKEEKKDKTEEELFPNQNGNVKSTVVIKDGKAVTIKKVNGQIQIYEGGIW